MMRPVVIATFAATAACVGTGVFVGCIRSSYPDFLVSDSSLTAATMFADGNPFTEILVQARTFTKGTAVTTVTYRVGDARRIPQRIDFNGDGKLDPVASYGGTQAVIQILLSQGASGTAEFTSLTLDSKRDMEDLADVAVGDIDNDGFLDIVGGAGDAVYYFHHPSDAPTTDLSKWGNTDPLDDLRERIDSSFTTLSTAELQAIIEQAAGVGVAIDDYTVVVEQVYSNVEIGDFDNDGNNDIAASRSFEITLTPKEESAAITTIQIVDGDLLVFLNPGSAVNGVGWTALSVGRHERQQRLDRDGAAGLLAVDVDGDGDLDLVSAARTDNNVQVAWFENPGAPLNVDDTWPQWRIGSVRDARGLDVADLTGDGRPDVIVTGGEQQQMILFEQPADNPKRTFDWDTHAIVTFKTFQPRDVKALDMDNDGTLELVVGGTGGAVRYFEMPSNPRDEWEAFVITTFDPPGDVGLLGYGDLDGDGDLDLVALLTGTEANEERITWIRNDLSSFSALTSP